MGIRRARSVIIISLLIGFSICLQAFQVYVEAEKSSNSEKLWDGFLAAGPTFLLAFLSIRSERKKEKKNNLEKLEKERENNEKKRIQDKEQLEKEWYNQIVLKKIMDSITDYFDYTDDQLKDIEASNVAKEIREKRLVCLRKLSILNIFDEILYKNCVDLLLESVDNLSDEKLLILKKRKNSDLKIKLIKELYKYIKK